MTEAERRHHIAIAINLCDLSQNSMRLAKEHLRSLGIKSKKELNSSNLAIWQAEKLAPLIKDLP